MHDEWANFNANKREQKGAGPAPTPRVELCPSCFHGDHNGFACEHMKIVVGYALNDVWSACGCGRYD